MTTRLATVALRVFACGENLNWPEAIFFMVLACAVVGAIAFMFWTAARR